MDNNLESFLVPYLPQKIVHMSKKKEEDWDMFREADLGDGFLQQQLYEAGTPHDHAGGQCQPLVVGDGLVRGVPHGQRDEEVEGDRDQDWGQEANQEQEKEIIFQKILINHTSFCRVNFILIQNTLRKVGK